MNLNRFKQKGHLYPRVEAASEAVGEAYIAIHGQSGDLIKEMRRAGCIWDGNRWYAPASKAAEIQMKLDGFLDPETTINNCPDCGRQIRLAKFAKFECPFCAKGES